MRVIGNLYQSLINPKMSQVKFKTTLVRGLALGIPIAVIMYVFIRILVVMEKLISPAAERIGIERLLGEVTLTVLALGAILLFILLLGFLTRIRKVENLRTEMESLVLKFIPSLYQLKAMADDKLDLQNAKDTWKPVILLHENKYSAAFIIEEEGDLITLLVSKTVTLSDIEILVTKKSEVKTIPVNYMDLQRCSKAFGKGFISLIKSDGNPEAVPSPEVEKKPIESKLNVSMNGGT
jgi:hypothetical protein